VEFGAGDGATREFRLDIHVDVFELGAPSEPTGFEVAADGQEVVVDGLFLGGSEDADASQHAGVGE
jgi:hypothetical protein